jgi:hypothetical protein
MAGFTSARRLNLSARENGSSVPDAANECRGQVRKDETNATSEPITGHLLHDAGTPSKYVCSVPR